VRSMKGFGLERASRAKLSIMCKYFKLDGKPAAWAEPQVSRFAQATASQTLTPESSALCRAQMSTLDNHSVTLYDALQYSARSYPTQAAYVDGDRDIRFARSQPSTRDCPANARTDAR
jgi:hypothetical protein